ncbi:hypothetical protein PG985_015851 [Apiospora marii]|uniref:EH domain-containing protein n=1 Tax=Apiospora marii TaxID=335849 RepID=A0ABR1S498_9PEZI
MHHPPPGTPTGRLLPSNSPAAASPSQNGGAGASAYSTALRGASLAFQKSTTPRPTPKSSPGQPQKQQQPPLRVATSTKDDGNRDSEALIAATSASRDHSLSRASPTRAATATGNTSNHNTGRISRQATGSSSIAGDGNYGQENGQNHGANNNNNNNQRPPQRSGTPQKQQQQNTGGGAPSLRPPGLASMGPDPRSPSFIAATLAASRSASPSRREQPPPQQVNPAQVTTNHPYAQQAATRAKRKDSAAGAARTANSAASSVTDLDLTDTTPIPATNSLISMFEKKEDAPDEGHAEPVKRVLSRVPTRKATAKLHTITPPLAESPMPKSDISPSKVASALAWEQAPSLPTPASGTKVEAAPTSHADKLEKKRAPTPPVKSKKPIGAASKPPELEEEGAKRKPIAKTPPRPATANRSETAILSPRPTRAASHKIVLENDLASEGKTGEQESTGNKALLDETLDSGPRPSSTKTLPAKTTHVVNKPQPRPPRPRRSSSTSSKDTFVSASSAHSPRSSSPQPGPSGAASPTLSITKPTRRAGSAQSLPARKPVPPPAPPRRGQAQQPNTALSSLTNATMAGILASSRASPSVAASSSSPTGPPAPPPPRKPTPHMRQTLRQPPKSEEEEEKDNRARHKKKHLASKKKHAHHEGARRRWREQMTERERKRYEGVWASNRGLLLSSSSFPTTSTNTSTAASGANPASVSAPNLHFSHNRRPSYNQRNNSSSGSSTAGTPSNSNPNPADFVANVVARDIWSRSRLPFDELAEVWDLVDSRGIGALDKTEFVVGMWLIDQRLRGRKIPQRVSESVWSSARGGHVRVPAPSGADHRGHKHLKK